MTLSLAPFKTRDRYQHQYNATWQDYVAVRDSDAIDWQKIAFDEGWLWIDMGSEGPNHASLSDLITIIIGFWAFLHPDTPLQSYGRCLIEHPDTQACAPDLVLYRGDDIPRWQSGEPRRIVAPSQRLPDLVGEISDTTLSLDLDEQKQLYAKLQIPEYWVVDVKGLRLFAFGLTPAGVYEPIQTSQVLAGLAIDLVEQAIERSMTETNTAAANWVMTQWRSQQ
ncbi:Uma2 family endonuclease [Leptolyngbya iicbica]|uniref:Uma2 family endonuclease n=2 Tax=Cyanophyceae TaxID=3028117 RepID=A0A4Q7E254_9CYAN|nr:Uma2 family endonuclease [Leptolyngbya sp. LK]RZM75650.1 Uma2 family endonuclease [Leptolyngbya sp. LK]